MVIVGQDSVNSLSRQKPRPCSRDSANVAFFWDLFGVGIEHVPSESEDCISGKAEDKAVHVTAESLEQGLGLCRDNEVKV